MSNIPGMIHEGGALAARLQCMGDEELEQLAEERWKRLRPDIVCEVGSTKVTDHAPAKHGEYFLVPKFNPEE